jgi:manganese efflux pump family protein
LIFKEVKMISVYLTVFFLSVGLAMDAFAVSIGYGVCNKNANFRSALRLSFHTALFQVLMPLAGWFAGNYLGKFVSNLSPWIAFALLAFIGIKMILESFKKKDDCDICDISRGKHLIMVCLATSIDAFAAGLSIGLLNISLIISLSMIGIITFILTFAGVYAGKIAGVFLEKWAEIAGGAILILIGLKILLEKFL